MPGPYVRNPDHAVTMLGERQWQWLGQQLEVPAELRLFASSVQVLADFTGWEGWANFAHDRERLFDLIRRKRADGVLLISGDIHYAEMSKLDVNVPYTLWDLTSSGLTEEWRVPTPNANRVSEVVADANFGFIDIDWQGPATRLALGIVDASGSTIVVRHRARRPRRQGMSRGGASEARPRRALRPRRYAGRQRDPHR